MWAFGPPQRARIVGAMTFYDLIRDPKFLPSVMVVLSEAASIRYAFVRDWRHAIYWLASAVLVSAVTY